MVRTIRFVGAALGHALWWLGYQAEWSRARSLEGDRDSDGSLRPRN
jgi:hypothetical protein